MKASRIACATIPNFSTEVCLREDPKLGNLPLALAENDLDSAEIVAVNRKAAKAGVQHYMTAAQAHVVCSNLTIKTPNVEKEIEQSNSIYKKFQTISPFVEETEISLYYLDATGFALVYKDDRQFAKKIMATVKQCNYPVKLGVAKNKFIARVAADVSKPGRFTIVPLGSEKRFLHPLPIEHLRLSSKTSATLYDLGLKTIGQVATFPANEMIRRFGQQGLALSRLARGDDIAFLEPAPPTEPLSCSIWLTASLYQATMITAQTEKLLSPLLDKLSRLNQGCCTVEIRFDLEDKNRQLIPIRVDRPTLSVSMFIRQLRVNLEGLQLTSPVTGITVTILTVATLPSEQLLLETSFIPGTKSSASLNNLSGRHTIATPMLRDALLPEQRFSFLTSGERNQGGAPTVESENKHRPWSQLYAKRRVTGLRLIQPPRKIGVITRHNHPIALKKNGVRHPISNYLGPWELSGSWWSNGFNRLYHEIETNSGQCYLLFFDRLLSRWFLQGIFD